MVEKILNDTTPYGKIRASHEGSLHSSPLMTYSGLDSLAFIPVFILFRFLTLP